MSCSWGRHVGGVISWGRNDRKSFLMRWQIISQTSCGRESNDLQDPFKTIQSDAVNAIIKAPK